MDTFLLKVSLAGVKSLFFGAALLKMESSWVLGII
jgi:hypothetical protein